MELLCHFFDNIYAHKNIYHNFNISKWNLYKANNFSIDVATTMYSMEFSISNASSLYVLSVLFSAAVFFHSLRFEVLSLARPTRVCIQSTVQIFLNDFDAMHSIYMTTSIWTDYLRTWFEIFGSVTVLIGWMKTTTYKMLYFAFTYRHFADRLINFSYNFLMFCFNYWTNLTENITYSKTRVILWKKFTKENFSVSPQTQKENRPLVRFRMFRFLLDQIHSMLLFY